MDDTIRLRKCSELQERRANIFFEVVFEYEWAMTPKILSAT